MLVEKLKEFLKDASFYGLSNVLGQLIGFFLIPLYTAYLTPDDYGVLTLLGFYALFYSPLSHLGLHGAMFRYIGLAKSKEEEGHITSTALKAVATFSVITTTISFLLLRSLEKLFIDSTDYTDLFILTVITAFFSSLAQFAIAYLRIKRRVKSIFWLNIGNLSFSVILNIILIVVFKMGLSGIVITNAIAAVLFFIAVFWFSKVPFDLKFDGKLLKKLLGYGVPNVPHYMQATVMIIFGQYYLGKTMSSSDLGLYAVAWKFCIPFQAIIGIIQSSWSAYKFELVNNVKEDYTRIMSDMLFIMMIGYTLIYVFTSIAGKFVLEMMTAEEFYPASSLVPLLALVPLSNGLYYIFGTGVAFGKHQYYMPIISFFGTFTAVGTALWLVPGLGPVGAAISSSLGWIVMSVGVFIYGQYLFKIDFKTPKLISLFALNIGIGIYLYLFDPTIWIRILVLLFVGSVSFYVMPIHFRDKSKLIVNQLFRRA